MRKFLLGIAMLVYILPVIADNSTCKSELDDYKVLTNSRFPFSLDGVKACFFAFYTTNPHPTTNAHGDGNTGDAVWYGYYELGNLSKIYELPKPSDTFWSSVCQIDAVSFWDMNGDKKPDVTIIGSCDSNVINHTYPLVFIRSGGKYILDKDVYINLYGFIALTIADVHGYMKSPSPELYRKELAERYLPEGGTTDIHNRVATYNRYIDIFQP